MMAFLKERDLPRTETKGKRMKQTSLFVVTIALFFQKISALAGRPIETPLPHPIKRMKPATEQETLSAQGKKQGQKEDEDLPGIGDASDASKEQPTISDPIESVNRAFFVFNDKVYFWLLKPTATGYKYVFPQCVRRSIKNCLSNLRTPVRLVNCALQGEFKGAWTELERLGINSVVGVLGFGDPAKNRWAIEKHEADLGQTFGRYGMGTSIYFVCPFLGPFNVRDGVGYRGDLFLDPINYFLPNYYYDVGLKAYETVNATSLRTGEYEAFKKAALDPYVSMRDAYVQYRYHFVEMAKNGGKDDAESKDGQKANERPADPLRAD